MYLVGSSTYANLKTPNKKCFIFPILSSILKLIISIILDWCSYYVMGKLLYAKISFSNYFLRTHGVGILYNVSHWGHLGFSMAFYFFLGKNDKEDGRRRRRKEVFSTYWFSVQMMTTPTVVD